MESALDDDPSAAEALEGPFVPLIARPEVDRLWTLFLDLHVSRQYAGMGTPSGLSYQEMDAYQRVTGTHFERYEVMAIRAADRAFLEVSAERAMRDAA